MVASRPCRPCLMTEFLEEIADRQTADGVPLAGQVPIGQIPIRPLSRGEKLLMHVSLFVVGSGSLVLTDLGRGSHHLWFWPWVAGWAGLLAIHAAVVLARARRRAS